MAKRKKYEQRSTKYTQKSKDQVTRTPLKTGGEQTYTHNKNILSLEKTSYEPYYNQILLHKNVFIYLECNCMENKQHRWVF